MWNLGWKEFARCNEENGLLAGQFDDCRDRLGTCSKSQTVDKTLLVSTPEAFFLFWVQKVCT